MKNSSDNLGDFFCHLPQYRTAPPSSKPIGQEEKARRVAEASLKRLFFDGVCRIDDLEADALKLGITGRVRVTIGAGVGGKGGLNAFCDRGHLMLCADNVANLVSRIGRERFAKWLSDNRVTIEDFSHWLQSQPTV